MQATPETLGIHHMGLTVPDVEQTRRFFTELLGFAQVGERPDYPAVFLSDGAAMVTLWQAEDPKRAVPFDRKKSVGLHHFALRVRDPHALDAMHRRLRETAEVQVEFAPEPLQGTPMRHLMCTIPGGIRLELICDAEASPNRGDVAGGQASGG